MQYSFIKDVYGNNFNIQNNVTGGMNRRRLRKRLKQIRKNRKTQSLKGIQARLNRQKKKSKKKPSKPSKPSKAKNKNTNDISIEEIDVEGIENTILQGSSRVANGNSANTQQKEKILAKLDFQGGNIYDANKYIIYGLFLLLITDFIYTNL